MPVAYFIACSKSKRNVPCTAKRMYQGTFFKKSIVFALQKTDFVYVLSAKYGILPLDKIIEPYELHIKSLSAKQYKEWINKVQFQFIEYNVPKHKIFLTPKKYSYPFDGYNPLIGLSIGNRLQWINQKLKKNSPNLFWKNL